MITMIIKPDDIVKGMPICVGYSIRKDSIAIVCKTGEDEEEWLELQPVGTVLTESGSNPTNHSDDIGEVNYAKGEITLNTANIAPKEFVEFVITFEVDYETFLLQKYEVEFILRKMYKFLTREHSEIAYHTALKRIFLE